MTEKSNSIFLFIYYQFRTILNQVFVIVAAKGILLHSSMNWDTTNTLWAFEDLCGLEES